MSRKNLILIVIALILIAGVLFLKSQSSGTGFLYGLSNGGKWLFPLVTAGALIDSLNPCAFSVLLLTIAFLFSLGSLRIKILKVGAAYIFGIFAVYYLIGLGILHVLYVFNTPNFMAKIGALILIVLGLITIINEFFPAFPIKLKIPASTHLWLAKFIEKGSVPTAFILGGLVGIFEFPCAAGPYLSVLGLLHDKASYLKGLAYLFYYNLIFTLPLSIILIVASDKTLFDKFENWRKSKNIKSRVVFGLAMIILGIIILML